MTRDTAPASSPIRSPKDRSTSTSIWSTAPSADRRKAGGGTTPAHSLRHGTCATARSFDEAAAARDAMADAIAARREGRHPPDSVLCTGWPVLYIEPHPGADFPAMRPRYE